MALRASTTNNFIAHRRRRSDLWDAVAAGELHLTGLLMLGPHLTEENISQVLYRAKHRTKKEIARLVRQLDPLPEVPPRIEPLGPAPARLLSEAPTWEEFVHSMCPVRELSPGERPRDWMGNANDSEAATPARFELSDEEAASASAGGSGRALPAEASGQIPLTEPPRQVRLAEPLSPQRYKVQFTAGEEYVKLVEEARALLSHSAPRATLDEVQLRAMRLLVTELKRQKHSVTARPQKPGRTMPPAPESLDASRSPGELESAQASDAGSEQTPRVRPKHPRRRGRHVPAALRRAVFERDEARCTYADGSGRRCGEIHRLELHHLRAFAQGGEHTEENLTLRCHSHNALAAEEDFGREVIELSRDTSEHELWAVQTGA